MGETAMFIRLNLLNIEINKGNKSLIPERDELLAFLRRCGFLREK